MSYLSPQTRAYYQSCFFKASRENASNYSTKSGYVFYGTKVLMVNETNGTSLMIGMSLYQHALRRIDLEVNMHCFSAACRAQKVRRTVHNRPTLPYMSGRP